MIKSLDSVYGMDEAALKTVKQWTFTPARDRDGIATPVIVTIGFDLRWASARPSKAISAVNGPAGAKVEPPERETTIRPAYPLSARLAGVKGVVVVEAFTNPRGEVVFARTTKSVPELDQAALEAVRQWKYSPTRLNGSPTETLVTVTIQFELF